MSYGYDSHGQAISHLVAAMGSARKGEHQEAQKHLNNANKFAQGHAKLLQANGQNEEAIRYMDSFRTHEATIKNLAAEKQIKDATKKNDDDKLCKTCKGDVCKCEKIQKADAPKTPKAPSAPKTGQIHGNPEYDYKAIHELHPEDQMRAQRFFNHKDAARYKYPVDKKSGRIVHGQRMPMSATDKPPQPGQYKEVPSHLREGAAVRIHAPGTKFHGRFGVVSNQSGYQEGKTAVHIGSLAGAPIHFPHEMIHPSKPAASKVEKAIVTLRNIRKAFMMKSEDPKDLNPATKKNLKMFVDKMARHVKELDIKPADHEEYFNSNWQHSGLHPDLKNHAFSKIKKKLGA